VATSTRWAVDLERLHATLTEISETEEQISADLVNLLQQIQILVQSVLSRQPTP
jgi:2'-5' RNA ligase